MAASQMGRMGPIADCVKTAEKEISGRSMKGAGKAAGEVFEQVLAHMSRHKKGYAIGGGVVGGLAIVNRHRSVGDSSGASGLQGRSSGAQPYGQY